MLTESHKTAARRHGPGPFQVAGDCFRLLLDGPAPLSVDGRDFPGLPARRIPLNDLRDRLLSGRCGRRTRDRVWAHLATRARTDGPAWTVACVGMALPALSAVVDTLITGLPPRRRSAAAVEVQAEVLTGFLAALGTVELDRPGIAARLRWAAYRAGRAALTTVLDGPTSRPDGFVSAPPRPPAGHPDFVLAAAVRGQVISRTEADLIGATRLEDVRLPDWAATHGMDAWAAYKMRARAEHRLAAHLTTTTASGDPDDPVATQVIAHLDTTPTHQPTDQSRRVAAAGAGGASGAAKKSAAGVSKTGPKSGLLPWGHPTPSTPAPAHAQEASQCA
jgi:hypothetical protein